LPAAWIAPFLQLCCGLITVWTVVANKIAELATFNGVPTFDAAVFSVIGVGILHGKIPYLDFWDQKPPGIDYIDAAIYAVFGPSPWITHLVEVPVALASAAGFYWLARSFAGRLAAAAGATIFVFFSTTPDFSFGGNLTETYWPLTVIFAFGIIVRYIRALSRRPDGLPSAFTLAPVLGVAGALFGLSMLLMPQGGLDLALGAVAVVLAGDPVRGSARPRMPTRLAILRALVLAGTAIGVCGAAVLYFVMQGAAGQMWSQVIVYNSMYARAVSVSHALRFLFLDRLGLLLWGQALTGAVVALLLHRGLVGRQASGVPAAESESRRPATERLVLGVLIA
jgi:hypothetical protein